MEIATLLTPSAIIGAWKARDNNFLLRLRRGYAGLKLSYLLSQIVAQGMRQQGCPEILVLDRVETRLPERETLQKELLKGNSKGKGKVQQKDKNPGKRGLAPVGAPAAVAAPAVAPPPVDAALAAPRRLQHC